MIYTKHLNYSRLNSTEQSFYTGFCNNVEEITTSSVKCDCRNDLLSPICSTESEVQTCHSEDPSSSDDG